jgi:5-methylcytosine-specific restriction endonuclease McrA
MMSRRRTWNDDELANAVVACRSMAAVLRMLRLKVVGGNYDSIRRQIGLRSLDTSHWTRQGHRRGCGRSVVPAQPLEAILRPKTTYQSNKLRQRLIAEGYFKPQCRSCGLRNWMGAPIPLELDHVDGDHSNNSLGNLRLLCPNCHAQTPTYKARSIRYDHIPSLEQVRQGIARCGSIRTYAKERQISSDTVRGWLRSDRLKRAQDHIEFQLF